MGGKPYMLSPDAQAYKIVFWAKGAGAEPIEKAQKMSGPALRSRGPQGQTQAACGGCRAEQTCERRSIAAAS